MLGIVCVKKLVIEPPELLKTPIKEFVVDAGITLFRVDANGAPTIPADSESSADANEVCKIVDIYY